jgi:hypothetical protein
MKKTLHNFSSSSLIKATLFTSVISLLTACDGGGGDSTPPPTTMPPPTTTPTDEECEVATFANAQRNSSLKINWQKDTVQFVTDGVYSRVKKLTDGSLVLVYSAGSDVIYRISTDNGNTWAEPVTVASGGSAYGYTNAEFIELSSGTWVYSYNARPKSEGGVNNFQIKVVVSYDKGVTWSDEQLVFDGGNITRQGVWEPAFLELPSKELQLYFANESVYKATDEQQISLMRSFDEGITWSAAENVSYRPVSRDGMAVPILLNDQSSIVFSIEDNGIDGDFKPVTIRTDLTDNWLSGSVNETSDKRKRAIVDDNQLETNTYGGAPYIDQLPSGETLISIQSSQCRKRLGLENSLMRVYIGDNTASNFAFPSTPFTTELIKADGNALWSAITVLDDTTVMATSSITTGDSAPNGIYIVKGTITRN